MIPKLAAGRVPVDDALARMQPQGWQSHSRGCGSFHLGFVEPLRTQHFMKRFAGFISLGDDVALVAGLPLLDAPRAASGIDFANQLRAADGVFVAFVWLAAEDRLHILTDFLGCQPLYEDGSLYASSTRAFAYQPDPRGWGAVIAHGHCLGSDSLLEGVRRVDAAQHIVLNQDGTRSNSVHWRWPETEAPQSVEALARLFAQNIDHYAAALDGAPSQLLLSGGYDSRLVAAAMPRAVPALRATIIAHEDEHGDADGAIGKAVARTLNLPIAFKRLNADFFSSRAFLTHMAAMDASYPTHGLFISQVMQHLDADAVWGGELPNVAQRAMHPEGGFAEWDKERRAGREHRRWQAAFRLFKPAVAQQLFDAEAEATRDSRAMLSDDDLGVGHWVMSQHVRRRNAANGIVAHGEIAVPLSAGASRRFWTMMQTHPSALRRDGASARAMLERLNPVLAALPVCSEGKLIDATPGLRLRSRAGVWLAERPRIARVFGWPITPSPSRWLDHPALYVEDDDWLDPDALARLHAGGDLVAKALLLHWRCAHWLHEGRLEATLLGTEA